jgi:hypothetical protein
MQTKYKNKPVNICGIRFPSIGHANRYIALKADEIAGKINNLSLEVPFILRGENGGTICKYIADFTYDDNGSGKYVIEEYKGIRTATFVLKWKLMQDNFPKYTFIITGPNITLRIKKKAKA